METHNFILVDYWTQTIWTHKLKNPNSHLSLISLKIEEKGRNGRRKVTLTSFLFSCFIRFLLHRKKASPSPLVAAGTRRRRRWDAAIVVVYSGWPENRVKREEGREKLNVRVWKREEIYGRVRRSKMMVVLGVK